ncbi:phospholipase C/P1 nuclease domain-containing protein [Ganoderma leucocontextum]|nr:phospholipase C/P1 nuclease domain-containing protein [Ganoderma leucocontextum]
MRTSSLQAFVFAAVFAGVPTAYAWGAAGHEIVATIAQIHLPKPVLETVCDILNSGDGASSSAPSRSSSHSEAYPPCHLAPIAAWADQIRGKPQYRYTAPLHYINALDDLPADSCAFPGPQGWHGRSTQNVLAALGNVSHVLRGFAAGEQSVGAANEALKFFVHWVGDMHQPLHMSGREKGGNGARVAWNGRVTNLHSVWDGLLIAQSIRQTPRNYSSPLEGTAGTFVEPHLRGAIYDPYIRRIMHEGLSDGGRFHSESPTWLDCPEPASAASEYGFQERLLALDDKAAFGLTTPAGTEKKWDDGTLCPYAWAKPIHALNCELPVWPHELDQGGHHDALTDGDGHGHGHGHEHEYDIAEELADFDHVFGIHVESPRPPRHPELVELDTPEYAGKIADGWVVEQLLAMAGVRLAGLLTDIFHDVSGELPATA